MICSVDGCGRDAKGRGWCSGHYMRWRRDLPDPQKVLRPKKTTDLTDLLQIEGGTWHVEALALRLEARPDTVKRQLYRLKNRGLVEVGRSGWRIAR